MSRALSLALAFSLSFKPSSPPPEGSGDAFINASGTVLQKTLKQGETVVVDTDALVAWEKTGETPKLGAKP